MSQMGRMYDDYQTNAYGTSRDTDRFFVRSSVCLPDSEVDPATGMLRNGQQHHGRTQALRREAAQLDRDYAVMESAVKARMHEKGIRFSVRSVIIGFFLLLVVLAIALLVQRGMLAQQERMLRSMNARIETLRNENNNLESQIALASDSATVCYAAARNLGMVPAASTQAIHLTAMETRPASPADGVAAIANAQSVPDNATGAAEPGNVQ